MLWKLRIFAPRKFPVSGLQFQVYLRSMCGRYTITGDLAEVEKLVRFICKGVDFKPRYNLTPRQQAPVLVWGKRSTHLEGHPLGSLSQPDVRVVR